MRNLPGTVTDDPFLFGEYAGQPAGGYRLTSGKAIRNPRLVSGESTGVLILAGQSNICNQLDGVYTPTNASKIDNINIYDGGTYEGTDALLGCTLQGSGHIFTRVADKLITAGWRQRVILVPIAIGGTLVNWWATDAGLNKRLLVAPRRLAALGLSATAFIWMQGESDNQFATSQASYSADLSSVIATPRTAGYSAPWLVGKCTYFTGTTSSAVRAAQAAVVNGSDILAGADTDTLTGTTTNRQADNIHFKASAAGSGVGADGAAELWKTAIVAAIP